MSHLFSQAPAYSTPLLEALNKSLPLGFYIADLFSDPPWPHTAFLWRYASDVTFLCQSSCPHSDLVFLNTLNIITLESSIFWEACLPHSRYSIIVGRVILLSKTSSLCPPSPNHILSIRGSPGSWEGTLTLKIFGSMQRNCFQCELLLGLLWLIFPATASYHYSDWLKPYQLGCDTRVSGQGLLHCFWRWRIGGHKICSFGHSWCPWSSWKFVLGLGNSLTVGTSSQQC